MDTIFINSENSRTLKPHILTLSFGEKVILHRILVFTIHGKI